MGFKFFHARLRLRSLEWDEHSLFKRLMKILWQVSVFVDYLTLSQKWSGELDYQFQPY
jgi:hypothetical protein